MENGESGEVQTTGKGKKDSWLMRQSCFAQFLIIFVPLICLTAAVIVLAILLDNEMRKQDSSVTAQPTQAPTTKTVPTTRKTVPTIKTTTTKPSTTTAPDVPKVCTSESCVAAAGSILASMNKKANPCNDFYQYTCGGYERDQNIPSGYSKYGSFDKARNAVLKNLRDLLEETGPQGEAEARVKARRFYSSCLDSDAIDENGIVALAKLADDLGGFAMKTSTFLPDDWSLESLLEKRNAYSLNGLFSIGVGEDIKNVTTSIIQLSQGGLGLGYGTRDYYLDKDVSNDTILSAYTEMLEEYAHLILGHQQVEHGLAAEVVLFEQELAKIQQSNSEMRDPTATYNKQTIEWLQQNSPFLNWLQFYRSLFNSLSTPIKIDANEPVLIFATPYLTNLTTLIGEYMKTPEKRRTLHNYVIFQAVLDYAPKFGFVFRLVNDAFQTVFSGKKGSLPKWQECVTNTDKAIGFAVGGMYVDDYFLPEAKTQTVFLINSVSAAFRTRVVDLNWMDKETKDKALGKVDALRYEAAYPDWVKNDTYLNGYYASLNVTTNFVGNQFASYWFLVEKEFGTLRTGRDENMWYMTPQTVNAYYSQTENKFVIPAGILTPPFFYQSTGIPLSVNFGAIGVVIGHEISHGFDDKGSQYDKDGNLANWWSEDTLKTFGEKTHCLVDQYSAFEAEGLPVNGEMTLGENIGDNGGLQSSYLAYKTSVKPSDDSVFVGLNFTSDQLFFIGYAQVWCSLFTPEAMRQQILQDVHSPGPFRVNGPVANSPDFAKTFNCPVGSPMNPVKKCTVW